MDGWLKIFIVAATTAIIIQMGVLLAMYRQFRSVNERMMRIANDLQARVNPVLTRVQVLLDDVQPRLSSIAADASEITHLVRQQAVKVDRVFTDAVDRLRLQVIRADQILTGALDAVEEAGSTFRRTVGVPVQRAMALIRGVQAGLEFFRAGRQTSEPAKEHQEEGLFI